jgi:hypothetical protein
MSVGVPNVWIRRREVGAVLIDCDTCEARDIACDDCVVSVLLGTPRVRPNDEAYAPLLGGQPWAAQGPGPGEVPLELEAEEQAALQVLADFGLVPPLRLAPSGDDGGQGPSRHAV